MFLLASDFDRTFYINNYDFKKNVDALGGFMKDNLFVIVTGRSYQDYMNITKNYVPVNYLVLNHGATVLKDDKVIRSVCIDNKVKDELKKLFDFDNIEYFATKDKLSRVSIDENDLSKINISMKDNLVAKKAVEYINSHFKDIKAYVLFHKNQFEIVSSKANKCYALEYIGSIEDIDRNNIYTVGDGYTDIEMVKYYNGYCVNDAVDDLKKVAVSTVGSVSEIIDFLSIDIKKEEVTDELVRFINACYQHNHYFEKYMSKIYGKNSNDKNHLVIRNNNEIIGCALIVPNKIYFDNDYLDILTVGSICVKEEYRHKGYLKILMGAIKDEEKKYDLSILSGDKLRYSKYGYYPNILSLYKINSKKHDNIIFKEINDDYIDECLNMYNNGIHSIRTKDNFKDILKQWKCESYYTYQDNSFIGYLIYNTKQDYISEIKSSNIKEVIESFGIFKERNYISLSVLNNDYSMNNIVSNLELSKMYSKKLYSINNIEKVIKVCLDYKLKCIDLVNGSISIKINEKIIRITVDSNNVVVDSDTKYDIELDYEQFMNIILNKKLTRNNLLSSWFYLDIDMYNNDLV